MWQKQVQTPGIQFIVLSPTPDYTSSTFVVTVRITVCQHILSMQLSFALFLHLDGLISPRLEGNQDDLM